MSTLSGKALLDTPPDFATEPTLDVARPPDMVAMSEAPRLAAFPTRRPMHRLFHEWAPRTLAGVLELEQFFAARAGKWQAFYVPSWHGELELSQDLLAGQQFAKVRAVGYGASLLRADEEMDAVGGHVFFYGHAGVLFATRVSGASDGAESDVLTLGDVAPADFLVGECVVGFVYHVRMAQDEFLARFMGPGHARVSMAMVEVFDVTPEPDDGCIGIHDFFEDYELGDVSLPGVLILGCGLSVSSLKPNRTASVAFDSFELYDEADPVDPADINAGLYWDGVAQISENYARFLARETFEEYASGGIGGGAINEGEGWTGTVNFGSW